MSVVVQIAFWPVSVWLVSRASSGELQVAGDELGQAANNDA